jgi:hypothetical protein
MIPTPAAQLTCLANDIPKHTSQGETMINHHTITSSIAHQRQAELQRQAQRARLARNLRRKGRAASAQARRLPAPAMARALRLAAAS